LISDDNKRFKVKDLFDSTGTGLRVIHPRIKLDFSDKGSFVSACKRVMFSHLTKRKKPERIGLECLKQPKPTKATKLVGSLSLVDQNKK
jgi:hypothetical protein